MLFSVITTIQQPTLCMRALVANLEKSAGRLIVAGDTKGPFTYDLPLVTFLDIDSQQKFGFRLAEILPTKHYARKNIAYLYAIREKAECIYETDDDNRPNENWGSRSETVDQAYQPVFENGWINVYQYFTKELIWPRGLPLDQIRVPVPDMIPCKGIVRSPIQQGLVNNSADVDAIWRLLLDRPFFFNSDENCSVYLPPGVWCPFNTQSTWWWPVAYPLLYIPSYCSFRMCDIWKSFVAQRCLWELDMGVTFHPPEVIQDRNEHNLHIDFEDEIPGYLQNNKIRKILKETKLKPGEDNVMENLFTCYEALVKKEIFPIEELELVKRWCYDINLLMNESK